uniref:DNA topoisomerase n=1 Tax=Anthurium amnicola TaxID=1678845 RepID=A0A1D1XXJ9_9ARAE
MAFQLRRLLGTGCLQENLFASSRLPPAMFHCRPAQNFSDVCITYSSLGSRLRYAKSAQLRTTAHMGIILDGHGQGGAFWPHSQLRVGSLHTMRRGSIPTFGLCRVGVSFRYFSSKNKTRFQSRMNPKGVNDNIVVGREKSENSLLQIFQDQQKQGKSLSSCSRIHGELKIAETMEMGGSNVMVTTPTVKNNATKASKSSTGAIDTKKTEKQLSQHVSKRQGAAKCNAKTQQAKTLVEDNQQPNSKKLDVLPAENISSGEVNVKGKSSTRRKKTKGTAGSVTSKQPSSAGVLKTRKNEIRPLYPPSGKSVVVVESVTKARIIQNYLGDMFEVLPSYGHVRDLAGRSGSVRPDDDFSMVWEVPASAWTHLKSIKVALSGAESLILASDPDREGEAIAWHIIEMLQHQDALSENINVARVVFHEITEAAIKNALKSPRDIDINLVHAYLARRALDYLIGFSISPLLWRKLPGCQSAGRVQSAALALICDKEMEIDQFEPQEYWTVEVEFGTSGSGSLRSPPIRSQLIYFNSKKLDQLSISTYEQAETIKNRLSLSEFKVVASKTSKLQRSPPMPYITSTLQQDSANRLQFTAAYTMKLAQKLYEGVKLSDAEATGLITYMRTDGMHVSDEAARDIHSLVIERYGAKFAAKNIRKYFKKVKNAQEAHEAIRPTSIHRLPSSLVGVIDEDSLMLYALIWVRTVACQMETSTTDLVQVNFGNAEGDIVLRSTASRVGFLGFQAVYQ